MIDRHKLNVENIAEAIRIYHKEGDGGNYTMSEADIISDAEYLLRELEKGHFGDLRLGLPHDPDVKLSVWSGSYLINTQLKYELSVFTNDLNDPEENKRKNTKYKERIEKAWKDAGFPIHEKQAI